MVPRLTSPLTGSYAGELPCDVPSSFTPVLLLLLTPVLFFACASFLKERRPWWRALPGSHWPGRYPKRSRWTALRLGHHSMRFHKRTRPGFDWQDQIPVSNHAFFSLRRVFPTLSLQMVVRLEDLSLCNSHSLVCSAFYNSWCLTAASLYKQKPPTQAGSFLDDHSDHRFCCEC